MDRFQQSKDGGDLRRIQLSSRSRRFRQRVLVSEAGELNVGAGPDDPGLHGRLEKFPGGNIIAHHALITPQRSQQAGIAAAVVVGVPEGVIGLVDILVGVFSMRCLDEFDLLPLPVAQNAGLLALGGVAEIHGWNVHRGFRRQDKPPLQRRRQIPEQPPARLVKTHPKAILEHRLGDRCGAGPGDELPESLPAIAAPFVEHPPQEEHDLRLPYLAPPGRAVGRALPQDQLRLRRDPEFRKPRLLRLLHWPFAGGRTSISSGIGSRGPHVTSGALSTLM